MSIRSFLVLAATSLTMSLAVAAPADSSAHRTLSPYFVVDGAAPGVDALPLKSTRVDIRVAGVIADVRVTQIYRNEGMLPLEARYLFPASTRAAVHAMTMRVGERLIEAQIREKQAARREYDAAKQEGRSAALLEQQRANALQMSVAHVLPGDEIVIELAYTETVLPVDGVYRLVYPAVVGPRYNGAPGAESHRAENWIAQPTLRAGTPAAGTRWRSRSRSMRRCRCRQCSRRRTQSSPPASAAAAPACTWRRQPNTPTAISCSRTGWPDARSPAAYCCTRAATRTTSWR
jgi:Ca-activated chloride channel homolog